MANSFLIKSRFVLKLIFKYLERSKTKLTEHTGMDRSHQSLKLRAFCNRNRLIIIEQSFHRCNQMKRIWAWFCLLLHKVIIFNNFLLRPIEIEIMILRLVQLIASIVSESTDSFRLQIKSKGKCKNENYDVNLKSHRNEINAQMPILIP